MRRVLATLGICRGGPCGRPGDHEGRPYSLHARRDAVRYPRKYRRIIIRLYRTLELQNVRTSQGFTLIEVLIATMILSVGLMVLMTGLSIGAKMIILAKDYQKAQYVFSLGELKYPVEETDDVEKDLTVSPDSSLVEGYEFERTVDEKQLATNEVDDELYTVRTIVSWGRGENQREELVRYVRKGKKR